MGLRGVRLIGPPAEMSLGETVGDEPETVAVIAEQFESGGVAIAEDKEGARDGIFGELTVGESRQSVDPDTESIGWQAMRTRSCGTS